MVTHQSLSKFISTLLLSPSGAIDRVRFSTGTVLLTVLAFGGDLAARLLSDRMGLVPFLFALAVLWMAGCLWRKRLHDLGRSGWLIIAFLAVYIGLVLAAPFTFDLTNTGSWRHAWLMTVLFAGPMVAWLAWLAIAPGEVARQADRAREPEIAEDPAGGMSFVLRAGRM